MVVVVIGCSLVSFAPVQPSYRAEVLLAVLFGCQSVCLLVPVVVLVVAVL